MGGSSQNLGLFCYGVQNWRIRFLLEKWSVDLLVFLDLFGWKQLLRKASEANVIKNSFDSFGPRNRKNSIIFQIN